MLGIKKGTAVPHLDAWGTVADLGSTITEGEVKAFGHVHFGTPTSPVSAGYFACTKGRFEMVYPFSEHATVIEGECELLNRDTGKAIRYQAGDAWFIEKGTLISWHVISERFVKHYMAVE